MHSGGVPSANRPVASTPVGNPAGGSPLISGGTPTANPHAVALQQQQMLQLQQQQAMGGMYTADAVGSAQPATPAKDQPIPPGGGAIQKGRKKKWWKKMFAWCGTRDME
ncbi:hypothetical protein HK405_000892, partial [Cladochytrium tenue]